MAIEGPLKELGVHDVFQLLDLSQKTGLLRIVSDLRQNEGTIYFNAGDIVYAVIKSNPHPLGGLLVRSGKITEADLQRARALQLQRGVGRLGEILVEIGALSHPELARRVRQQIEEVIFEVMAWQEGHFAFTEGEVAHIPLEASIRIPVGAILMEGARRIDEWSRIQRKIPSLLATPVLAAPDDGTAGPIDLLPTEWEALAFVDGQRNVREIAAALGRSEFDIAKTMFGLACTGLVEISLVRPGSGADRGEHDVDALLKSAAEHIEREAVGAATDTLERAVLRAPNDPRTHTALGHTHLMAGRPSAAVDSLRKALHLDPQRAEAYRLLGFALTTTGQLQEALDTWQRWSAFVSDTPGEAEYVDDVNAAREAAKVILDRMGGAKSRDVE